MVNRVRARLAWGVLDQALISFSSMVVLVLVARHVSPEQFGAFGITMEAYLVIVFIGRGLAGDPLATAHAGDGPLELTAAARSGTTVALGAGLLSTVVVGVAGVTAGGMLGQHLLVLGVLIPGLVLQDFIRTVCVVTRRPEKAFVLDASWLALLVPSLLAATAMDQSSVVLLAIWGVCGIAVGLLGLLWAGLVPAHPRRIASWLRRHRAIWPFFLMENLVFRATILLVMVVLTLSVGLAGVAGLRAATAIFAPVAVVGRGVVLVAVPELARSGDSATVGRGVRRLTVVLVPLPLILAAFLIGAPDRVGEALFGETWALASPLIWLTAISAAGAMYAVAVAVGLRATQAARAGLQTRIVVSLLSLVAALVGGWLAGAYGAALGLACSVPLQVAFWRSQLRSTLRKMDAAR